MREPSPRKLRRSPSPVEDASADQIARLRDRYIDLVKHALTHTLYRPIDIRLNDRYEHGEELREAVDAELTIGAIDWDKTRSEGRDWPRFAQTMVGIERLENVELCVKTIIEDQIPGDLIETGVWRGGVAIFMRAILYAFGDSERVVFAADSFQGLPPPNEGAYPADAGNRLHTADTLAVSRNEVARNFDLYGLLDGQVRFLEGWFRDTLPTVKDRTWAVARLDGDMYESTMDALQNLYPRLSVGGFLIVDDYNFPPCKQAVEDYRAAHGIREPIEPIDWLGAFWRRER